MIFFVEAYFSRDLPQDVIVLPEATGYVWCLQEHNKGVASGDGLVAYAPAG